MIRTKFNLSLKEGQSLLLVPIGDIHFDTPECDRDRLVRFVSWVQEQERAGNIVRLLGMGDYLDLASPSERRHLGREVLHDGTYLALDRAKIDAIEEFLGIVGRIGACFLGLITGHHHYIFASRKSLGPTWQGRSSDEWLAHRLGCSWFGTGTSFIRLQFQHQQYLDILALHGAGSAQTAGGRVQKRIRFAEIAPTAHLVISGHDNAKLAYPRSGLDWEAGMIKRYVIGSGSFQRAYLDENPEAGYVEQQGLVPADLGVVVVTICLEQRSGKWRVDYHCSV